MNDKRFPSKPLAALLHRNRPPQARFLFHAGPWIAAGIPLLIAQNEGFHTEGGPGGRARGHGHGHNKEKNTAQHAVIQAKAGADSRTIGGMALPIILNMPIDLPPVHRIVVAPKCRVTIFPL